MSDEKENSQVPSQVKNSEMVASQGEEASLLIAVVEASDDAIIGDTLDAIIVSWNQGAERQYGYTAKEALGKPASLIIPKEREGELSKFHALLQNGEVVPSFETQRLHKNGKLIDRLVPQ